MNTKPKNTNLKFLNVLNDILSSLGIKRKDFGTPLGWTAQNTSYHFTSDDMLYGDIRTALLARGYSIEAMLDPIDPNTTLPNYSFKGRITAGMSHRFPDYFEKHIANGGPLAFIGTAIRASGRTLGSVLYAADIDMSSFRHFIVRRGDMRVSYIYRIAAVLHAQVVWKVDSIN